MPVRFKSKVALVSAVMLLGSSGAYGQTTQPTGGHGSTAAADGTVSAVTDALLGRLDLSRPALKSVADLAASGRHGEALRAFWSQWFAAVDPFQWGPVMDPLVSKSTADQLLRNEVATGESTTIPLGTPGSIDWEGHNSREKAGKPWGVRVNQLEQFNPLLDEFVKTRDTKYLDKWLAIADDWGQNEKQYSQRIHENLEDGEAWRARDYLNMVMLLSKVGQAAGGPDHLRLDALTRVLLKLNREYLPAAASYTAYNPQNWTTGLARHLMEAGIFMDAAGFKAGQIYIIKGRREMEIYGAIFQLPDGTDHEQNLHYVTEYIHWGAGPLLKFLHEYRPDLAGGSWERELRDNLVTRGNFLCRILTPWGTNPAGNREDLRSHARMNDTMFKSFLPEVLADADNAAIVNLGAGTGAGTFNPPPHVVSAAWPFGGYYVIREGWKPDDQYAYFFSSPQPANSDWRSRNGNNVFSLAAFNQDMIVQGEVQTYDHVKTPLYVDGLPQWFDRGIPSFNHRHVMTTAWDEPADGRWLNHPAFNLAEATYKGIYADAKSDKPPVRDVSHCRQIIFIRDAKAWVIVDRITAQGTHSYQQDFRLPVEPLGYAASGPVGEGRYAFTGYRAFNPATIVTDASQGTVKTGEPTKPNLSLFHIGTAPISYSTQVENLPNVKIWSAPKLSDLYRLRTAFSGDGDQVLLTLIYPRKDISTDVASFKPLPLPNEKQGIGQSGAGFVATFPGGQTVEVQASTKTGDLKAGGCSAHGELVVVATDSKGQRQTMLLGADRINGAPAPCPDLVFSGDQPSDNVTAVQRPLRQVDVLPHADVFLGDAVVSMKTVDDGAQIHYTTDGSEPSVKSPVYREPIRITSSTTFISRSIRPGEDEAGVDPTLTGPITRAVFNVTTPLPAVQGLGDTAPGLQYEYYLGPWQDLYDSISTMKPVKSGVVSNLLDVPEAGGTKYFAYLYSGFINVPEDGVYRLHAPREIVRQNIIAGYDLDMKLDGQSWYPATRRHGLGVWSVALKAGPHRLEVRYIDHRGDQPSRLNKPEYTQELVWSGKAPELRVSGPGMPEPGPIPASWLSH